MTLSAPLFAAPPQTLKIDAAKGVNPWNNLDVNDGKEGFQFAVVTDRTGGHRGHVFQDGVAKLNLLRPDFVMSVGDLIEGYSTDPAELDEEWKEFMGFIKPLKVPFFYVPGNHDVQNPLELEKYHQYVGRDYYHFVFKNVLFLCLNSDDPYPAKFSQTQLDYAAKALAENKGVRWTLVFFHRPLWVAQESEGKKGVDKGNGMDKLDELLKGRPYTVFVGHNHHYRKYVRKDQRYYILATTGAGSEMRGPAFGEFDHVAWVTMTEAGPLVANVMLNGVWDDNIATEKSVGFMERLSQAAPTQVTSLFSAEKTIRGSSVRLKCDNHADLPLRVKLQFADNSALRPDPLLIEAVVPPNSVKFFDLPLKGVGDLNVADLGPVLYDWTLSYDSGNQPPLMIQGTSRLYVDGPLDLPAVPKPVVVDGKLDEWGPLPIACLESRPPQQSELWTGPRDCSFKFALRHDDKNFYFAARVIDDHWWKKGADDPYNQDGVWFSLDAEPETNKGLPDKQRKNTFWLMLLPGKTAKESVDAGQVWAPEGVKGVCLKTKAGFDAEGVIPYAGLPQRLGKPAEAVRVNVTVYDFDPSESQDKGTYFNWRPNADSGLDYPGSGTFYLK